MLLVFVGLDDGQNSIELSALHVICMVGTDSLTVHHGNGRLVGLTDEYAEHTL
jgi:hypothetical protein